MLSLPDRDSRKKLDEIELRIGALISTDCTDQEYCERYRALVDQKIAIPAQKNTCAGPPMVL